jgi:hypothetical protein
MEQLVIQVRFLTLEGVPANQFFGGISIYSHAPLWVNLKDDAMRYESEEQAWEVLDRIHARRAERTYSVVSESEAEETATKAWR